MVYADLWKAESTRDTNTLDSMYEFGLLPMDGRRILTPTTEDGYTEIEDITLRYITQSKGNYPNDRLSANFCPVNGLPFRWMLGSVTEDSGLFTNTNFTTGRKPSISAYLQGDYEKYESKGNVMMSLDIGLEIGSPVMARCTWMGMTHGISSATPTNAGFPSSVQTPFNVLDDFKWNNISYDIKALSCSYQQKLTPLMGASGFYSEISETSPIIHTMTIAFKAGSDVTAIITDKRAGTARAIYSKVLKADDNTKYWQHDVATMYCKDIQLTRIQGQPEMYVGIFVAGSAVTDKVKDGVASAFYGL